jgi:integrase
VDPVLGSIKTSEITFGDIQAFHLKRRETPYQANRGVMMLSKMLNLAEDWGMRPMNTNPTKRIKRYPEVEKKRYLDEDEQERLGTVMTDMLHSGEIRRYVFAAFYLLLLTGCRLGEIQKLKWDYVTRTHLGSGLITRISRLLREQLRRGKRLGICHSVLRPASNP